MASSRPIPLAPSRYEAAHLTCGFGCIAASRKISRLLTDYTFGLTLLAYLLVGVGGHVAVRGSPPANVLNAYEPSIAIALAQIALICALSISYPLMFVVARLHFFSLTTRYIDADRHHNVISTSGVVLSLLVAICFPMVENVLGLLGATSSVSLSFVVPAMLYQKYVLQVKPQNSIAFARCAKSSMRLPSQVKSDSPSFAFFPWLNSESQFSAQLGTKGAHRLWSHSRCAQHTCASL